MGFSSSNAAQIHLAAPKGPDWRLHIGHASLRKNLVRALTEERPAAMPRRRARELPVQASRANTSHARVLVLADQDRQTRAIGSGAAMTA